MFDYCVHCGTKKELSDNPLGSFCSRHQNIKINPKQLNSKKVFNDLIRSSHQAKHELLSQFVESTPSLLTQLEDEYDAVEILLELDKKGIGNSKIIDAYYDFKSQNNESFEDNLNQLERLIGTKYEEIYKTERETFIHLISDVIRTEKNDAYFNFSDYTRGVFNLDLTQKEKAEIYGSAINFDDFDDIMIKTKDFHYEYREELLELMNDKDFLNHLDSYNPENIEKAKEVLKYAEKNPTLEITKAPFVANAIQEHYGNDELIDYLDSKLEILKHCHAKNKELEPWVDELEQDIINKVGWESGMWTKLKSLREDKLNSSELQSLYRDIDSDSIYKEVDFKDTTTDVARALITKRHKITKDNLDFFKNKSRSSDYFFDTVVLPSTATHEYTTQELTEILNIPQYEYQLENLSLYIARKAKINSIKDIQLLEPYMTKESYKELLNRKVNDNPASSILELFEVE